jgi:hypothetical protein
MKYRFLMYGEPTSQLNMRVPESKKAEIQKKFEEILKTYENPKRFEITYGDEKLKEVKKVVKPPKKIEPQVVEETEEMSSLEIKREQYLKDGYKKVNSTPFGIRRTGVKFRNTEIFEHDGLYYVKHVVNNQPVITEHKSQQNAIFYITDNIKEK